MRTGASQKALRYYEQLGVLAPVRGGNGYREYREADVRVVEVVRSLGRLGIPVERPASRTDGDTRGRTG